MPQITLKISHNIEMADINFRQLFTEIHDVMGRVPNLDNRTCFGGVIKEDFSYVGRGDDNLTKIFLEILWLETPERVELKPDVASELMPLLLHHFKEPLAKKGLVCSPRIRIADLGEVGKGYMIYKPA